MEKKNVVFLTVLAIATLLTAVVGTTFAYFTATVTNKTTPTTTTLTTADAIEVEYDDGAQINLPSILPGTYATKTFTVENKGSGEVTYSISWTDITNQFATNTVAGSCSNSEHDSETCDTENGETWTPEVVYNDFVYSLTKNGQSVIDSAQVNTRIYPTEITDSRAYSKTNGKAQIGATGTEYFVKAMPSAAGELVGNTTIAGNTTDTYVLTVYYLETGIAQNENAGGKQFAGTLQVNLATTAGVQVSSNN